MPNKPSNRPQNLSQGRLFWKKSYKSVFFFKNLKNVNFDFKNFFFVFYNFYKFFFSKTIAGRVKTTLKRGVFNVIKSYKKL